MREPIAGLNRTVLTWARERSGLTVAQVAERLGKDPEVVAGWEAGPSGPTYPQLEKLAYDVYKRPIAVFFFPEPPAEPDVDQSFRTLPDTEIAGLLSQTRYRVRQARAMQLALYELNDGRNPADSVIFRDITASLSFPDETAARVRDNLGVSIDVQQTTWRTVDDALRGWRDAIEDRGVFVFKNSFKQREVSGFCLHDPEFPIIYVNNSTPATRQVFTILHELGHLLAGSSGITKSDDHFIARLSGRAREIELFCNRFAAEVLLPAALLPRIPRGAAVDEMRVADIAAQFKVSREVVLRRYRDQGAVTRTAYEELVLRWRAQDEARAGGGGGNYYATQGAYFGQRFLKLAFGRYYQGTITVERLADMLDVRPANVLGLEPYMVEGR